MSDEKPSYMPFVDPVTKAERDDYVVRESDGALIPRDPENVDWQAYQAWLDGHG